MECIMNNLWDYRKIKPNIFYNLFFFILFLLVANLPSALKAVTPEDISSALAIPSTMSVESADPLKPSGTLKRKKPRAIDLQTTKVTDLQTKSMSFWTTEIPIQKPPMFNLDIQFENDSTQIIYEHQYLVGVIAKAISSHHLKNSLILISGHTDSLGSEKYNMKLSKARADKLKSLLQSRYDISSERLITVGFGETMNLKGKASNHPANRRVQLYNITQIR